MLPKNVGEGGLSCPRSLPLPISARVFFFLILRSAAPSEASRHFSQDRQVRAKFFAAVLLRGAQAASLFFSAACRKARGAIPISLRLKMSSASCRRLQARSLCSPEKATELRRRAGAASAHAHYRLKLVQCQVVAGGLVCTR